MALKDLSGKTVFDLEPEDFDKLFCAFCKGKTACDRQPETMNCCRQLIDAGIWDRLYRKQLQD